jgi:formate dehydrogenase (NADP+) beta subunit
MSEKNVSKECLVVPPCREACPAGIDVPRYIRRIKEGNYDEALAVIRERIPFPSICGYACFAPCEAVCGNRQYGDPIAIRELKKVAAEKGGDGWRKNFTKTADTGKRVAVVGSGPGGLSAAYYLAALGHRVTVFESLEGPGGMMRVGIPEYRLPRAVLDSEIEIVKETGVEIKTGCRVESADKLLADGFDSVFLACGTFEGLELGIPGEDLDRVKDGISFLHRISRGESADTGKRVVVIGGGNTAIDAARSAIRQGAEDVLMVYRRSRVEMPASLEEIEAALEEGVKLELLTTPVKVAQKGDSIEMTFVRMALGKPDESGRATPIPVEDSEFALEFDTAIVAIGQIPEKIENIGVCLSDRGLIKADEKSLSTDKAGVFAGGDVVTGPASIIDAIAHGRKAAASIDRFLGGDGYIDQELATAEEFVVIDEFKVDGGKRCVDSIEEAGRCRNCDARQFKVTLHGDGCKECSYCVEVCGLDVFGPADGFNEKGYRPMMVKNQENCVGCQACYFACPDFSIDIEQVA